MLRTDNTEELCQSFMKKRIHPDFELLLSLKEKHLTELFRDIREYVLEIEPGSNELLYHTHALTAVFSLSDKLADAFCMIPVYNNHLNLGFNKGTLLKDPHRLLTGTGNLIRHIDIHHIKDYRNKKVKDLIKAAATFARKDMDKPATVTRQTISKIKIKAS